MNGSFTEIIQVAAAVSENDAISNMIFAIDRKFKQSGFRTKIFAEKIPATFQGNVHKLSQLNLNNNYFLVYHYGIGFDFHGLYEHPIEKKRMVFYGVTPSEFFEPYSLNIAGQLKRGLDSLEHYAKSFQSACVLSDSTGNVLLQKGFRDYTKIPFIDNDLIYREQSKRSNSEKPIHILVLGRISPNKRLQDAIKLAYYLKNTGIKFQMNIVGRIAPELESYYNELVDLAYYLQVTDCIRFFGMISPQELEEIWQQTDFYFTASMHEGFCVPVIEAMVRDVVVIGCQYNGSSIEQTMGGAGILCYGFDPAMIAELIDMHNPQNPDSARLYENCLESQRKRMTVYRSEVESFLTGSFFLHDNR